MGRPDPSNHAADWLTLDRLEPRRIATVRAIGPVAAADDRPLRLRDLGFVVGESVMVVARAWPGGDPMVVRVGGSRFALRRTEAACVAVEPLA